MEILEFGKHTSCAVQHTSQIKEYNTPQNIEANSNIDYDDSPVTTEFNTHTKWSLDLTCNKIEEQKELFNKTLKDSLVY